MLASQVESDINSFSTEMKLMLLLSVKEIDETKKYAIQEILDQVLNWNLFLTVLQYHRTYPIVYQNISKIKFLNIPETVLSNLKQKFKGNMINILKFTGELIRLMKVMKQNEIRAISLKGPLLGMEIYGDLALRTSRDLDILIDCTEIERVEKILLNIGYQRIDPDFSLTAKQKTCL